MVRPHQRPTRHRRRHAVRPGLHVTPYTQVSAETRVMARNSTSPKPAQLGNTRCAIYTRKSSEDGLELEFNSLDAQREACEAYIKSQASEGWRTIPTRYDDPAYSGGNLDRPALQRLLKDIEARQIDGGGASKTDPPP